MDIGKFIDSVRATPVGTSLVAEIYDKESAEYVDVQINKRNNSGKLAVFFAGATRPRGYAKNDYPNFPNSLDDPTMNFMVVTDRFYRSFNDILPNDPMFRENISISGWYALSQRVLSKTLKELSTVFTDRLVLIGGSSGGFASIFFGYGVPNCISIACNPQIEYLTNLNNNVIAPIESMYREDKMLESFKEDLDIIRDHRISDLRDRYKDNGDNSIIYVVNNDSSRDFRYCMEFMQHLREIKIVRSGWLVLHSSYWGISGHKGIPLDIYKKWLKAAMEAEEPTAADANKKYWENQEITNE